MFACSLGAAQKPAFGEVARPDSSASRPSCLKGGKRLSLGACTYDAERDSGNEQDSAPG